MKVRAAVIGVALPELLTKLPPLATSVTTPVPALMLTPLPRVRVAVPLSRLAPMAPGSPATAVRLPLSVLIVALSAIERPACSVKAPPLPDRLLALMAAETVMSLLACNVTAVPASSSAFTSLASSVLLPVGSREKMCGLVSGVPEPPPPPPLLPSMMSTRPALASAGATLLQFGDCTSARPSDKALTP